MKHYNKLTYNRPIFAINAYVLYNVKAFNILKLKGRFRGIINLNK